MDDFLKDQPAPFGNANPISQIRSFPWNVNNFNYARVDFLSSFYTCLRIFFDRFMLNRIVMRYHFIALKWSSIR